MRSRTIEFRTQGVRGLPAALLLGLGVLLVGGLFVLLLFVGAAVAVTAVAVSAVLALWHGVRRKLGQEFSPRPTGLGSPPPVMSSTTLTEAREIEVEVLPKRD